MKYRVLIQPCAEAEIESIYAWIADRAPRTAIRWRDGLLAAVASLSEWPRRCGLAAECEALGYEIRQLLYGRRGRKYRVLFTIVEDRVHVLHFRHWAEQRMEPDRVHGPEE